MRTGTKAGNMRYQLVRPVRGGYSFFDVYDTKLYQTVVSVFAELPGAEEIATELCNRLNHSQ